MPFTPYHFGPSVFAGLVFRKWLDVPVFLLANVIIDLEVVVVSKLGLGWPYHRYGHTLLIGAAVGIIWGLLAYPLKGLFKKIMNLLCVPYKTGLLKMMVSGILGIWLHVSIDAIYHGDVRVFWPAKSLPLWNILSQSQVRLACLICFALAIAAYGFAVRTFIKRKKLKPTETEVK